MSITTLLTAEQFLAMPDDGLRYELIAGELRKMSPASMEHCNVVSELHGRLWQHVFQHKLGKLYVSEPGFRLSRDPDTVRMPDIAFLRRERLRGRDRRVPFWSGAPDLAVEVVSPNDTQNEVDEKVKAWLDAGAAMVWVVNPARRSVTVYRNSTDIKTLTEKDKLDGEDVVPGFRCRVGEIFENL